MTFRTIILIVLAIGCAAATALFARDWVKAQRTTASVAQVVEIQDTKPSVVVLVAAEALSAGSFVRKEALKWQAWPDDGINEDYIVRSGRSESEDEAKTLIEKLAGAVARGAIVKGQPITDSILVHPGERGFLAAVLTPGFRAVSVPVNATTGISGFIFPGDLVDLLLTVRFSDRGDEGASNTRHATKTILEGIRVLAIDQIVEKAEGEATVVKNVTLEVKPEESEKVALALDMGSLSLSLRSLAVTEEDKNADNKIPPRRATDLTVDQEVLATNQLLTHKAAGKHKKTVTVLKGSDAAISSF